jgi:3-hydroxyacyl-[acyl-carrier-protein] dehydratase
MERLNEAIRASVLGRVHVTGDVAVGRFRFDEGFPGFEGHFPGRPLLPAVVQVMAALLVAEEAWGTETGGPLSVDRAKFLLPLEPGVEIRVQCTRRAGKRGEELVARVHGEEGLAGSFTLIPGEVPP